MHLIHLLLDHWAIWTPLLGFQFGGGSEQSTTTPYGLWGKLANDPRQTALQNAFLPVAMAQAGNAFASPEAIHQAALGQTGGQIAGLDAMRSGMAEREAGDLARRGVQGPQAGALMAQAQQPIDEKVTEALISAPQREFEMGRENIGTGADFLKKLLGEGGSASTSSGSRKNIGLG